MVAVIVGIATAPLWARGWVREQLTERLAARLELPVELGKLELAFDRADVFDVVVGDPEAPLVRLDVLHVELDPNAWWRGQVVVEHVEIDGGRVEGSRAQLEELAARMRRPARAEPSNSSGRLRLVPDRVAVHDLWLVVDDPAEAAKLRHLEARIDVELDPGERSAELTLADVRAELRGTPIVSAAAVRARVVLEHGHSPKFPLRISFDDLGAPVTPEIAVAGVDGWVELSDLAATEVALDVSGGFSDRAEDAAASERLWSLAGRVRRDLSAGTVVVDMAEFELGRVPEVLRGLPVVDSEHASVGGHIAVVFGGGVARVEGDVSLEGLNVDHPVLAKQPVRDLGFELQFAVELDPRAHRLRIDHADVQREGVALALTGEIVHPPERRHRHYRLDVRVPAVPCQAVLDAVPAELIPSLQGFVLDGDFNLDVRFDADYADLDRLVLGGRVGISECVAREVPAHASSERLGGAFTHRVTMRDGRERVVQLYAGSGTFTPYSQISPHMVQAVLTTEDGGFWRHDGFLPSQFRNAMQRNLAAGKVRLGASTITMQTVKNVLLSHERTLSRKLQELFLTWYVETALSKERIMEIYLNVVEFGPGIYGVTRAARHYFGKYPEELTPPEAAYLALMLPSPVRRHSHYCHGVLAPSMQIKLSRILSIMRERNRLSEEDYALWKDVPLQFDSSERDSEGACLGEIQRLLDAQEGQRALTGLLGGGRVAPGIDEEEALVEPARARWTPSDDGRGREDGAATDDG
ncbi:MAG: transglycosylase domain-containing protein, partial [Deltaproteobacteria bacterium]|nr:transglycosylase domain-containing protein [Nannocystaceae bacterium]